MILKKESILFSRDEKGELIPQEVSLVIDEQDEVQNEYKDTTIVILPMSRGEVKRLFSKFDVSEDKQKDKDLDKEIIVKYCINPDYSEEDVNCMKPSYSSMIVNTIMFESGLSPGNKKKSVDKKEDDFAKN